MKKDNTPEFLDYLRRNYGFTYTTVQLREAMWKYMHKNNVSLEFTIGK